MHETETLLLLLMAVVVLVASARRFGLPYPVLLVLGGLALGFIPGLPHTELKPDTVFLLFLPPLLFAEAWLTSWRDFQANLRPILLLSLGLVLVTTVAVALVVHFLIPGFPIAAACVLGAIAAPTDAVAVSAVGERLRLPSRIFTILSGESLVNDASALVIYRSAVAAVVGGTFSLAAAGWNFVVVSAGGIGLGVVLGYLLAWLLKRVQDTVLLITITLLMPFAAYLPAEHLGVSGVLATVTLGLYVGRQIPHIVTPQARIQGRAFWSVLVFLLNGLLFILVGLQLRDILADIQAKSFGILLRDATFVCATVIAVRFLWVFGTTYAPQMVRRIRKKQGEPVNLPAWERLTVVAWGGARGAVSLASALAVPLVTETGAPFPHRNRILFLTFSIIFATLIVQGISTTPLIAWLNLSEDEEEKEEENQARLAAAQAALARLEEIVNAELGLPPSVVEMARARFEARVKRLNAEPDSEDHQHLMEERDQKLRLRLELLDAEQEAVVALRDEGVISDDALHQVQRDLDLEELMIEPHVNDSASNP